ncbi:hypothetical protein H2198_000260 [Neophaeococcomyces mojaviensis]|uniref:Uncharacterized protein n=1 Tax=Neophaeococcomyces mojaviensis TaxID=3383035 RepID=A0ACC3AK82_9EURO|nr:hypothetical protein H2198_000260 [Knufia sp. JES_112]
MGIKSYIPSFLKPVDTPQTPYPIYDFKGPLFHKHTTSPSPRGSVDATVAAEHAAAAARNAARTRGSAATERLMD